MKFVDFIKERGFSISKTIKCDPEYAVVKGAKWMLNLFKKKKEK